MSSVFLLRECKNIKFQAKIQKVSAPFDTANGTLLFTNKRTRSFGSYG